MGVGAGLTLSSRSAYRLEVAWVDRCRMSTPTQPPPGAERPSEVAIGAGGRCQPKSITVRPNSRGDTPVRVLVALSDTEGRAREQAYVPAEQPPPSQGARFPPAHAHPRRPRHPVRAPPQGPQEPRGLRPRGLGPPLLALLPRRHRLTDPASFKTAVRRGRRAGGEHLVVHLLIDDRPGPAQVGFVVGKAVGPAVVRNRVKRRLRHLARESLTELPGSAVLVVRALPPSAGADSAELGADLRRCLSRVLL